MIESVDIQNFRNIRKQQIELEPLTVFVGANGSGKTSVLEAVHLAVRAATGEPERVFSNNRHCDWLYTRGGRGDLSITCQTTTGMFEVAASPLAEFPPPLELMGKGDWKIRIDAASDLQEALQLARSMVFLHLDAEKLARPSYSDRDPPRVEHDGKGLVSVLAYMALNDPDAFQELVSHMRGLIPHLRRLRFRKAPITRSEKEYLRVGDESLERRTSRTYLGEGILFDFSSAENLPAHSVSEGTLMLLGLLTVLLGPSRPRILLMDDIEQGLHPMAQKSLLGVLRKVMERFHDLQILATAHSPYLLNYLSPEQVRIMTAGPDGHARCGRLTDHPKFAKWKEEMAPGEMWSLFGEQWLVQEGATS